MCSVTLPFGDSQAALYGVLSNLLFVLSLPSLELQARTVIGQLLQFSFERAPLLIAPSVDPRLNAMRHRDA
jgi:hypothetical protein